MSEQDTELLQILISQISEDAEVDAVLVEKMGILAKAELGKPLSDLLHCRRSTDLHETEASKYVHDSISLGVDSHRIR
jgi:hypothetical protein